MLYAEILLPQKVGNEKETLTYSIPEDLKVEKGQAVKINLRNKLSYGIILDLHEEKPEFKTREITEIVYEKPVLNQIQLSLLKWTSLHYFCPLYKCLKLMLPTKILQGKTIKRRTKKDEQIFNPKIEKTLTKDQEEAVETITQKPANKFLIQGITGSGKTEIYVQLAKQYIEKNQQVLILVPEIALTPQTIHYFENSLHLKAAILHSKLSEGEKIENWKNIWEEKTKLVIGSRSSIFSPFQNLGLIIIDEEHESSYKQDQNPRYKTHKIADKISELTKEVKIVYGSATPSIETQFELKNNTIKLLSRIGKSTLPEVQITDLREEFHKKNFSIFSDLLQEEFQSVIKKKEQAILFINRRGTSSSVVCRDCGTPELCKNCELPLTYHSKTLNIPKLICHHCGTISDPPSICKNCKSSNIRYLGIGTQRIEDELQKLFPEIKILRADKDTTNRKDSFEKIYKDFRDHKADVLIGTQMIAKGLHLPKVSLVGVILADIGLNIADFHAIERNFQLMTQVSGRAGRGEIPGKVVIQTYNPENPALKFAQIQNYDQFYEYEIRERQLLLYPPFSHLIKLTIEEKTFEKAKSEAEKLENLCWKIARENQIAEEFEINTYPAYFLKLRGKFRYIILLKSKDEVKLHNLLENLPKEYIMSANLKIDIDPIATT